MSSALERKDCEQAELLSAYAMQALPSTDVPAVEAHVAACTQCRRELEALRRIIDVFASWPTGVLRR